MLTDTKDFSYLGGMKKQSKNEVPAQGAPDLTQPQIREALERDLKVVATLIAFIRSEPTMLDTMAAIAHELHLNRVRKEELATADNGLV